MCSSVELNTGIDCFIYRGLLNNCGGVILNKFYFKQGAYNPVKNKYFCSHCGVPYEPTNYNSLASNFEKRKNFAEYLFLNTFEKEIVKQISKEEIYIFSQDKGFIPCFEYGLKSFTGVLRVNKDHFLNENEKVEVFIPYLEYKSVYVPISYLQNNTQPD